MGGYKKLFSISILHSYFREGTCSVLPIEATSNTKNFFRNADLISQKIKNGISVSYNSDFTNALEAYLNDDIYLTFLLQSKDANFYNYTDFGLTGGSSLFFESELSVAEGEKYRMTKEDSVSGEDAKPISDESFNGILSKVDRITMPVGVVKISLADLISNLKTDDSFIPKQYYISFNTRSTYWRYNMIKQNDIDYDDLSIIDNNRKVTFSNNKQVKLANGQAASQIISQQAIQLKEEPDCHFDLFGIKDSQERLIIKKLVLPDIMQITKEEEKMISDLYVYY